MMRLFSKTLLRWNEPKALRVAAYKQGKRSLSRLVPIVLVVSLLLVGVTWIFAAEVAGRMLLVLGLLILFMYATLWIYRAFPACVRVTEKGISRSVTDGDETTWKFEAIDHCEIAATHVHGKTVRMLVVVGKDDERSRIGIADSVSTEALREILTGRGVKVLPM